MLKRNLSLLILLFCLVIPKGILQAQDINNVTVKYKQTTKIEIPTLDRPDQNPERSQRFKDMLATLPEEGNFAYKLTISGNKALYSDNPAEQQAASPEMERAMHIMSRINPPKEVIKQVFFDLEKQEYTRKLDFMTREFIIESEMETKAWKLKGEQKMIQEYVCMNAELQIGDNLITAWFTPQLPFSIGPEDYYGLPGLILAVEKNGVTIFVASSIEINKEDVGELSLSADGKKIKQEAFDKLVEEKKIEHKELMKQRPGMGGGPGHRGGGR